MLKRIAFVLVVGLAAACGGKTTTASNPGSGSAAAPVALADPANESLGGLSLGDPSAKVETALGAPTSKGEVQEWAATGDRTSTWAWDGKGVSFEMAERDGAFSVHSMSLTAPSTLTTSRGIGIGATFEQVDAAYKEFRGKGREEGEPEQWDLENGITVGSVYGGTMFNFENGKVSTIFVGAAAE